MIRQWISNLRISRKLMLVVVPPLLGSVVYGGTLLYDKYQFRQDLVAVEALSLLAVHNGDLVHELQKERGMSAGFIGSNGVSFADKLPAQRQVTDRQINEFHSFLSRNPLPDTVSGQLNTAIVQLNNLTAIRSKVDGLTVSVADEVAYYTQLNTALLSIIDLTAKIGADQSIAIKAVAFSAFLQMKERAGIERAVLSSTFGQDGFKAKVYPRFITLLSEQNSYQERFLAVTSDRISADYQQILASSAFGEVNALRDIAMSQASTAIKAVDPEIWFSKSTARIELLRQFETQLAGDLLKSTERKLANATQSMLWVVGIFTLMLVFVGYLSWSVSHYLHHSVNHLKHKVTSARKHFDLSQRIAHQSTDEIGALSTAFNEMMADFESVIHNVRTSADMIKQSVQQLDSSTATMHTDISVGQCEAEQVASAMTQMSATVAQIAANAVEASLASSNASKEAGEGSLEVGRTSESIQALAVEMSHASESIDALDKEIHAIVGVLEVISGIAEQTNLLALNAAIEAARAGELGRGFAVVADEVRNLAQRAQSSTTDIKTMTERLKSGAQTAVKAMASGQIKAAESVNEAKKAGHELTRIVSHVSTIDSMNEQIATATHQQSVVAEDVNLNATRISEIYQNTKEIANDISALNKNLLHASETMSEQVSKFIIH